MTIQNFDRQNLKQLRTDMEAALAAVTTKHGVTFSLGSMRFDADRVTCKVEANTTIQTASSVNTTAPTGPATGLSPTLQRAMTTHGVRSTSGRKGETLTAYNASRPKYPFSYETIRGTRYKQTVVQARAMFGAV